MGLWIPKVSLKASYSYSEFNYMQTLWLYKWIEWNNNTPISFPKISQWTSFWNCKYLCNINKYLIVRCLNELYKIAHLLLQQLWHAVYITYKHNVNKLLLLTIYTYCIGYVKTSAFNCRPEKTLQLFYVPQMRVTIRQNIIICYHQNG